MSTSTTPLEQHPDWTAAEAAASLHRQRRQHPVRTRIPLNCLLLAAGAAAWVDAGVLAFVGFTQPGDAGFDLALKSDTAMVVYLLLVVVWSARTGRFVLRGSDTSIKSALPPGTWRSVRRQLASRQPVDPAHTEVVMELAHQQRSILGGRDAFATFYIPFYVNIAHGNTGSFASISLTLGAILLLTATTLGVVAHQRFSRLIKANNETSDLDSALHFRLSIHKGLGLDMPSSLSQQVLDLVENQFRLESLEASPLAHYVRGFATTEAVFIVYFNEDDYSLIGRRFTLHKLISELQTRNKEGLASAIVETALDPSGPGPETHPEWSTPTRAETDAVGWWVD